MTVSLRNRGDREGMRAEKVDAKVDETHKDVLAGRPSQALRGLDGYLDDIPGEGLYSRWDAYAAVVMCSEDTGEPRHAI